MYPDYGLDYDYGYDILTNTNTLNIVEQLQEKVKASIDAIFEIIMNVYNQGIAFAITMLILVVIAYIMIKIAKMFIFKKAKVSPWEALIPIHSKYKMFEIVGINTLWTFGCFSIFLLLFSKVGIILWLIYNFGIHIYTTIKLMKVFGKSKIFIAGGIILPFVIYPIIAFGSAKYNGTYSGNTLVNSTIKIKNKNEIELNNRENITNKEKIEKVNKDNKKEDSKTIFGKLKKDKDEVRNPYMNGTKAQEIKDVRRIPTPMGANLQGYNQVFGQEQYSNKYMNNDNNRNMVQTAPVINNQVVAQNKARTTMMNAYVYNLNQNMNMSMNNNINSINNNNSTNEINNQTTNQNINQNMNQNINKNSNMNQSVNQNINKNINNNQQRIVENNNQINQQGLNKNVQNNTVNTINKLNDNNNQNKENNSNNSNNI